MRSHKPCGDPSLKASSASCGESLSMEGPPARKTLWAYLFLRSEQQSPKPLLVLQMNLKNRSFTGLTATLKTHRNVFKNYPKFVPFSVIMIVTGWRLLSTNLNSSWVKDVQTSWSSAWVAVPFSRFPFKITSIHTYHINIWYDDICIWIFFMFHHHLH